MATTKGLLFSHRLRGELSKQGLSVHEFSRRLANGSPAEKETARRNVYKWLGGTMPNHSSLTDIATALGVERSTLTDEEEEEPSLSDLLVFAVSEFKRKQRVA